MKRMPHISTVDFYCDGDYTFTWPVSPVCNLIYISPCHSPGWFRRFWIWFLLGAYWEKI